MEETSDTELHSGVAGGEARARARRQAGGRWQVALRRWRQSTSDLLSSLAASAGLQGCAACMPGFGLGSAADRQGRAGQGRAGQGRAGQGRGGEGRGGGT